MWEEVNINILNIYECVTNVKRLKREYNSAELYAGEPGTA